MTAGGGGGGLRLVAVSLFITMCQLFLQPGVWCRVLLTELALLHWIIRDYTPAR